MKCLSADYNHQSSHSVTGKLEQVFTNLRLEQVINIIHSPVLDQNQVNALLTNAFAQVNFT